MRVLKVNYLFSWLLFNGFVGLVEREKSFGSLFKMVNAIVAYKKIHKCINFFAL